MKQIKPLSAHSKKLSGSVIEPRLSGTSRQNSFMSTTPNFFQEATNAPFSPLRSRANQALSSKSSLSKFNFGDIKVEDYREFDSLRIMTATKVKKYLETHPIFFNLMVKAGALNPDVFSSIAMNFTPEEISKFVSNMLYEMNIFSSLQKSSFIFDFESILLSFDIIHSAKIWEKIPFSDQNLLSIR